jgi:molybdate transport system regulatory protein
VDALFEQLARAWSRRSEGASSRIFTVPDDVKHLDTRQLGELEACLRTWAERAGRRDVAASRRRVLLLYLLIRHAGARLGEACLCHPLRHYRADSRSVMLGQDQNRREVPVPPVLAQALREAAGAADAAGDAPLDVDRGHLRRKLYERADECGLQRELVNPSIIRRSRGIELLRGGVPLPVVQRMLGQSTPTPAGEYLDFSDEDMTRTLRRVMDRESRRTSARNSFFGQITGIERGDIQSAVRLASVGGHAIMAIITNGSLDALGFREGGFVTAEVKAPWVVVARDEPARGSAENRLGGVVARIERGALTTEVVVRLGDGLDICAIISEESRQRLGLIVGDRARVEFTAFSVILDAE